MRDAEKGGGRGGDARRGEGRRARAETRGAAVAGRARPETRGAAVAGRARPETRGAAVAGGRGAEKRGAGMGGALRVWGSRKKRMAEKIRARFEVLDERFAKVGGDDWMERVFDGGRWTEGPAYVPAGRYLVFSDIPNDRVLRWDETTGAVGVLREPADYANGRTLDRLGRLVSCDQGTRRVTRIEHDGSLTVL